MNAMIVADSSGLISLSSSSDQNHQRAQRALKDTVSLRSSIIIPADVFSETLNIALKKLGHSKAMVIAQIILQTETFLIVESETEIRTNALGIFNSQPESVSFIDCVVMATADSFSTKHIFGFDETFKKNGYIRLGIDK